MTKTRNVRIKSIFQIYQKYMEDIATHYACCTILTMVDTSQLPRDLEFYLRPGPDGVFFGRRTISELETLIQTGTHFELTAQQSIVQMCTAFEELLTSLVEAYKVREPKNAIPLKLSHRHLPTSELTTRNKSVLLVRSLHSQLKVNSALNWDETLMKIIAIIETRNCIVHSAAVVTDIASATRLRNYGFRISPGEKLIFKEKIFDDMWQYFHIHTESLQRVLADDHFSKKTSTASHQTDLALTIKTQNE